MIASEQKCPVYCTPSIERIRWDSSGILPNELDWPSVICHASQQKKDGFCKSDISSKTNLWTLSKSPIHHPGFWALIHSPTFPFTPIEEQEESCFRAGGVQCLRWSGRLNIYGINAPTVCTALSGVKSQKLDWQLRCRQKQETPRMEILNT